MFNMEDRVEKILDSLSKSKFRSSFHLKEKDMQYIKEKGLTKIKIHAYDFVSKDKDFSDTEINYIVYVIMKWIIKECRKRY